MSFYLGIDGGGTKTRCALGDEMRLLATSTSGACNVVRVGAAQAREALHAAVRNVCEAARVSPTDLGNICIGAAGAAREDVARRLRNILAELTTASVEVVGDTVIALESAFGEGPGVVAISGTGSIIYGRNARGETARAGGWGYAISDEGSAQWIGRRAVWSILRALDQGQKTKLTACILKAWNLQTVDDLVERANALPPPEFPTLFPIVLRVAEEGDAIALDLLGDAGRQLAEQTSIVIRRLFMRELSTVETQLAAPPSELDRVLDEHARVATAGSVFRQSPTVRDVFYNQLQAAFPGIDIRTDIVEPVDGALARARRKNLSSHSR